jgi:hypothetical protein
VLVRVNLLAFQVGGRLRWQAVGDRAGETGAALVPGQHDTAHYADQQRCQAGDRFQRGIQSDLGVDRQGHLEEGGCHPGFFLLGRIKLGALDGEGGLGWQSRVQLDLARAQGFFGLLGDLQRSTISPLA